MGTEVALSFSSLRAQLENERSSLYKIDENIKKIVQTTGRFNNDRFNQSGEYNRGGNRVGSRNSFPDGNNYKNDEQFGKRKHETKTVFSRLSARVQDSDGEEEGPGTKRVRMPSAVTRELPTRAAVLRAQGDDEQARTRNRRIFGSLLGTLQKFKQEEIVLQTKEDKKAQVERKIEEQARLEKEREQKQRKTLFAEREHKKATIKALEAKMGRVQEFEKWEESQRHLSNFILTKTKPHLYWLPKKMSDKANEKLMTSRKFHEKCMTKKRQELEEELQRIEQRCLRPRGMWTKENDPHAPPQVEADADVEMVAETAGEGEGEGATRGDKWGRRARSPADHEPPASAPAPGINNESKMDTSSEQDPQEDKPKEIDGGKSAENGEDMSADHGGDMSAEPDENMQTEICDVTYSEKDKDNSADLCKDECVGQGEEISAESGKDETAEDSKVEAQDTQPHSESVPCPDTADTVQSGDTEHS